MKQPGLRQIRLPRPSGIQCVPDAPAASAWLPATCARARRHKQGAFKQTTPKFHRNFANSLTCFTFYSLTISQICAVFLDSVLGHLVAMAFNVREPWGSRLCHRLLLTARPPAWQHGFQDLAWSSPGTFSSSARTLSASGPPCASR